MTNRLLHPLTGLVLAALLLAACARTGSRVPDTTAADSTPATLPVARTTALPAPVEEPIPALPSTGTPVAPTPYPATGALTARPEYTAAQAREVNAPTTARRDPAAMTVDLVVARPAGAVATVAGAAIFLVSWPFSALGGNTDEAWDSLVRNPAGYTFRRPLGDFDYTKPQQANPQP